VILDNKILVVRVTMWL